MYKHVIKEIVLNQKWRIQETNIRVREEHENFIVCLDKAIQEGD